MYEDARSEFSTTRKRLGTHRGYRRREFASSRKISRYSQISVTINPNAPYHSMYFGAPIRTPVSIMSKSSTKFSAAITTTKAERDCPPAAAVENSHVHVEKAQQHDHQVEHGDAAGCRDHAELEPFGGANHAGLVRKQHDK